MNRFYEPKSLNRINHCLSPASFVIEDHHSGIVFVSEDWSTSDNVGFIRGDFHFVDLVRRGSQNHCYLY